MAHRAELTGRWLAAAGAALVIVSTAATAEGLPALGFAVWALLPYAVLFFLGRSWKDFSAVVGAGATVLAGEFGIRAAVFVFPTGPLAAVALVYSPVLLSIVGLPLGAAGGSFVGRLWRSSKWLGVPAVIIGSALLAVLGFSIARPDLAPTAVWWRSVLLNDIGEPRVVTNLRDARRIQVNNERAWFQAAELDGVPGDEIAAVVIRGDEYLLDPVDFQIRAKLEFGPDRSSYWTWYSVLARLEGRVVVVQTWGQEIGVLELTGRRLWRYRPEPKLSPDTLLPADLDRDGLLEFYSVVRSLVVRLDERGQEVWSRTVGYGSTLLLSGPRMQGEPAWVMAHQRDGTYVVWDEAGIPLAELPAREESGGSKVVDLTEGRLLLTGTSTIEAVDLTSAKWFEVSLGDAFTFEDAVAVGLEPGASPHLAVVASAPRDVERWRLIVLSPGREVIYDEVLDARPEIFTARSPDGTDTLLVTFPYDDGIPGLWTLRFGS